MAINEFDELSNIVKENRRSMEYDEYFGEMELSQEQKEERIDLAEELEDVFFYILVLILMFRDYGMDINETDITEDLKNRYTDVVATRIEIDEYLDDYIGNVAKDVVATTIKNTDDYYTSLDRAMFISENEANGVLNYKDFKKAIMNGRTMKEWVAIQDKHTRKPHSKEDGTVIPILQYFEVDGDLMLFPHDISRNPKARNIVNCRCSTKYY